MQEEQLPYSNFHKKINIYMFVFIKTIKNQRNKRVYKYEDFRDNTEQEMIKTFDFLELNKDENIDFITRHNVGGKRWKNKYIKYIFMKTNCFKSLLKILIPKKIRYSLRKKVVNISTKEVVEMNVNTRQKLKNDFKEDVQKLSKIINRDVTHWTK